MCFKPLSAAAVIGMGVAASSSAFGATVFGVSNTGNFVTFDTGSGVETIIGPTQANMGLSFDAEGNLFGVSSSGLFSVNTTTGTATPIGSAANSGVESATFDSNGRLLAASSSTFFEYNTTTGLFTSLGAHGTGDIDGLTVAPVAVTVQGVGTVPAGTLFAIDTGRLDIIDPETLQATQFADLGSGVASESIAFTADGQLLGMGSSGQVTLINLADLTTQEIGAVTNSLFGSAALLAFGNAVQETVEAVEDVASDTASVQVVNVAVNVTNRVRSAFRVGGRGWGGGNTGGGQQYGYVDGAGRAAGDSASLDGVGAWVSPTYTNLDNDFGVGHSGHSMTFGAGVDKLFAPNLVAGVSLSYESSEADLKGALAGDSTESSGASLVAYGGLQIDEATLADAFLGYGWLENDIDQGANSASYDSRRLIVGATLSRRLDFTDKADVTGSVGLTHSRESFDDYTIGTTAVNPEDVRVTTASAEIEVARRYGEAYPYALLGVEKQLANSATSKDRGVVFGGGVTAYPYPNLMLEMSVMVRRGEFNDSESLNGSLRWTF